MGIDEYLKLARLAIETAIIVSVPMLGLGLIEGSLLGAIVNIVFAFFISPMRRKILEKQKIYQQVTNKMWIKNKKSPVRPYRGLKRFL